MSPLRRLGVQAFLGALSIVTAPWLLESPRWLVAQGEEDEAVKVLLQLRGYSQAAAEAEMEEIRSTIEQGATPAAPPTISEVLRNPLFRTPILVAIVLQIAQQMSGINGAS